eukprot:Nk52_evm60s266 gene=Nk52_evmTU60s266
MEVFVWSGPKGIPSIDPQCLQVITYARFTNCPLIPRFCNNSNLSPSGSLPALRRHGIPGLIASSPAHVIDELRRLGYNADYNLSVSESADSLAYSVMVELRLREALMYCLWVDAGNYKAFTRRWYAGVLAFPLNYTKPREMRERWVEHFRLQVSGMGDAGQVEEAAVGSEKEEGGGGVEDQHEEGSGGGRKGGVEGCVLQRAAECFRSLEERLGRSDYFFGNMPTMLDAIVFSYISVIRSIGTLPNDSLRASLGEFPLLLQHSERILLKYFDDQGNVPEEVLREARKGFGERQAREEEEEEEEKQKEKKKSGAGARPGGAGGADNFDSGEMRLKKWASIAFGVVAMVAYAFGVGMISIEDGDEEEDEEEDGYYYEEGGEGGNAYYYDDDDDDDE